MKKRLAIIGVVFAVLLGVALGSFADPIHVGGGPKACSTPIHVGGGPLAQ